jgi:predicted ATPase/signal transduction histidine kinase/CheY-like chemotaxis protein
MIVLDKKYQINELIAESKSNSVYRGESIFDRRSVIIKLIKTDTASFDQILSFQNQYTIANNSEIQGIIKAIDFKSHEQNFVLVLEDFGEISLQEYFARIRPSQLTTETIDEFLKVFLPIAIQITEILGQLYLHQIIHKDIKPANIRIDLKTQQVKLDNFSYATRFQNGECQISKHKSGEGTLAYASPEQSGRIDRGIDYRSDFYSLGITFYELLTGILPFNLEDRLELIYCHLTKLAISVEQVEPLIPRTLSIIVAKLMAKNAEDRYQSALGLQRDLEYCWSQWQTSGKIEIFELEKRSTGDRFVIPGKIYGRMIEVQTIVNAFQRMTVPVATDRHRGGAESILISGFFGVGKTAVINEACKLIYQQQCYLITGKFSNLTPENLPFGAFISAFSSLIEQLMMRQGSGSTTEDDDRLAADRAQILGVLGTEAQIIIDVMPELGQIIGQQAPVRKLSASPVGVACQDETRDRFKLLFTKLVEILTTLAQPLVICLDDLQWIDADSLELLELLMQKQGQLLIICAYQDHELSGIHPLMLSVNRLQDKGSLINHLMMSPLSAVQIDRLVAESLNASTESVQSLAALVHQKTNGNPFFAIKFLTSLLDDGLIKFDRQVGSWQCDLSEIKVQSLTNDEIELMATQLQKLPESTQQILKLAACMGREFNLSTVAISSQQSELTVRTQLLPALQTGSIVPLQETCNLIQTAMLPIEQVIAVSYRFTHDRVRQAAYSLIPVAERASVHAQIGELLLETLTPILTQTSDWSQLPADRAAQLLVAVDRLNQGIELTRPRINSDLLVKLNLAASRQVKATKAYSLALGYARIGLRLLGTTAWQQKSDLALTCYQLAIELAAICGEFDLLNDWIAETIAHVHQPLQLVDVYIVQIQSLIAQDRALTAIEIGRSILTQLGVQLPLAPTLSDVTAVIQAIDRLTGNRQVETFLDLPPMTDPVKLAIMQVTVSMLGACYITNQHLHAIVVALQVKLSIQDGNSPISAHSYAAYGIVINNYLQQVTLADRFSGLAYRLASQPTALNIRAETLTAIGLFLYHRNSHLRATTPILQAGYQAGLETGKLEYVGYQIAGLLATAYWCGDNLTELESRFLAYRQQLLDLNQLKTANYADIYCETVVFLLGNPDRRSLAFDRVADEELILTGRDLERVFLFYFHRAMLKFLLGDLATANADVIRAREYLPGLTGLICEVGFYFYDSLILLAVVSELQPDADWQARVCTNQTQLAHWAKYAPMNHLHKWQLVEAETYRILGDKAAAIEAYDLAIAGAEANQYRQEAALAHELAAKFYFTWGKPKIAADYLQAAYYYYTEWGATAKIHDITSRYPQLLQPIVCVPVVAATVGARSNLVNLDDLDREFSQNLDFKAHLKAIQALGSEIDLDRLLTILMDVVVANAGADKALLFLDYHGKLTMEIEYDHGEIDTRNFDLTTFDEDLPAIPTDRQAQRHPTDRVPQYLIRHVQRTQTTAIHDGIDRTYLANDPYFATHQPQSILCMPILNQRKLIGILYLENALMGGAFTGDRVELLNIICTQAAISLENARLHRESQVYAQRLEQSLTERQQFELKLQATNEELIRSNRLKDQFMANMSHELRTPLNAILGMAEGLKEQVFGSINPAQLTAVDTIDRSGTHLLALINDILDLAKIEAGKVELNCAPTDIAALCESSLMFIDRSASQKQLLVNVQIQPNLPNLHIDERRMRQVLINLLNNAVKFTPNGGQISLTVAYLADSDINVQNLANLVQVDGTGWIRITVSDTGIGIAPDHLKLLFQPFIQIDGALNRKFEGTGLGLALVKRMVDLHGGKVSLSSELGLGSSFMVELPCQRISIDTITSTPARAEQIAASPAGSLTPPDRSTPARSPIILLVEDNEANISTMSSYLKAKGYQIVLAHNGLEAINLTRQVNPDLIVMDIQMPVMDGLTATQKIREFSHVPIIALTALAMTGDKEQCLAAGANEYLSKPVKLKQLTMMIQSWLSPNLNGKG